MYREEKLRVDSNVCESSYLLNYINVFVKKKIIWNIFFKYKFWCLDINVLYL